MSPVLISVKLALECDEERYDHIHRVVALPCTVDCVGVFSAAVVCVCLCVCLGGGGSKEEGNCRRFLVLYKT